MLTIDTCSQIASVAARSPAAHSCIRRIDIGNARNAVLDKSLYGSFHTSEMYQSEAGAVLPLEKRVEFLDLPLELRYVIYGLSQVTVNLDSYIHDRADGPDMPDEGLANDYIFRTIEPNLRLVSKSIKEEVDAETPNVTTFIFEEYDPTIWEWITPEQFPTSMVSKIGHAVFKVHGWCFAATYPRSHTLCTQDCPAHEEIDSNGLYVQDIIDRLPSLKSCEIEVNIICAASDTDPTTIKHAQNLVDSIRKLSEIDKLTSIKVYKIYVGHDILPKGDALWQCWKEADGWHSPTVKEIAEGRFQSKLER